MIRKGLKVGARYYTRKHLSKLVDMTGNRIEEDIVVIFDKAVEQFVFAVKGDEERKFMIAFKTAQRMLGDELPGVLSISENRLPEAELAKLFE